MKGRSFKLVVEIPLTPVEEGEEKEEKGTATTATSVSTGLPPMVGVDRFDIVLMASKSNEKTLWATDITQVSGGLHPFPVLWTLFYFYVQLKLKTLINNCMLIIFGVPIKFVTSTAVYCLTARIQNNKNNKKTDCFLRGIFLSLKWYHLILCSCLLIVRNYGLYFINSTAFCNLKI